MMGLLLLCILITFVTMPYHKYTTRRFPINFKQFGNASIFCITLTCITYVLTYGKVLDWYDNPTIQWATVGAVVAGILFVYIEVSQRNPYYQFAVLKLRTIRFGFLFYFLLMVLNSSSMFVNVFTGIGMKLDNYQNATLGNWSMLGYIIGGIATIWLSIFRTIRHVHVLRGSRCRFIRTDEISHYHSFHWNDALVFIDTDFCYPAYALQIPVLMDLYDAHCAYGTRSQHRNCPI